MDFNSFFFAANRFIRQEGRKAREHLNIYVK